MARAQLLLDRATALADTVEAAGALGSAPDGVVLDAVRLLGELRRAEEALGAELAGIVAERSAGDDSLARRFGEKSAAALVAQTAGIEPDEASDWCAVGAADAPFVNLQGQVLPVRFPAVAEALAEGTIGARCARLVFRALETVSSLVSAEELTAEERLLVDYAPSLALREVRKLCGQVVDRANPDGVEPREDELRRRSGIREVHRRDGLVQWIVTMHPEAAGFLKAAIDARTAPRRQPHFVDADPGTLQQDAVEHDPRTLAQRRLDALVSVARDSLRRDDGELAGTDVTMVVTIAYESLVSGLGFATIQGVDTPISAATARRLACQADILPAVLGGPSEPLELGRADRLFSKAQRRAIALRDGGCTWPGCTAPPGWCEVAHILAWLLFGPTDLDNGILLCPFHHRRFDRDGWGFEWRNGVPYFIPPAHVDVTRTPRRGGRPTLVA